ncbi:MAG TPA: hypothetical protein VIH00_05980, partial [Candidatus Limnocylindrales bacterium]
DEVLKFADLFTDTLLFDDGDDGNDGPDTLISDINGALAAADLDDRLRAEADGGRIRLIATDPTVTSFSITAPSGNALGFDTSQSAFDVRGRLILTATSPAPVNGQLLGDVAFSVVIDGAAAVPVTVAAADTADNTGFGNDVQKLLDADGRPTFVTVQELTQRLIQALGPGVPVEYDELTDELTLELSLGNAASVDNFGFIDIPINFDLFEGLGLGPVAELSSDSTIRLSAGGGLTVTVGFYLGNEGAVTLTDATELSTLKGGITFSDSLTVAAQNEAQTVQGRLSADARFDLSVNGDPAVPITVARGVTLANVTLEHFVDDLNAAIGASALAGLVTAAVEDGRVTLVGDGTVTSMQLTAAATNPLVKEIGFAASQSAVDVGGTFEIKSQSAPSFLVGRLSGDAVFLVSLDGAPAVGVTVSQEDTASNRNILDLIGNVQDALDEAGFENRVHVGSLGKRLVFSTLEDAVTGFNIGAAPGSVAVTELGLATSKNGTAADLLITTRDGAQHEISLDGATTLGQVRTAIQSQTGDDVQVEYSDGGTRLKLIDGSVGTGNFKVVNALGSNARVDVNDVDNDGDVAEILIGPNTAALDLGILGENDPAQDTTNNIPDNEIEGGQLGGVDPLDRLFIRNAQAAASVQVTTPQFDGGGNVADTDSDGESDDGLNAALRFGFVGLEAHGGGTITGTVSVGLKPADAPDFLPDAKITLRDLIENVDDLGSFLDGPEITGSGRFDLAVSLTPAFPSIGTGANPTLSIVVHDLAGLIEGDPDAFEITTTGFEDLANFDDIGFADIVAALQALAEFLS